MMFDISLEGKSKQKILECLKNAKEATLKEQDIYREIVNRSENLTYDSQSKKELVEGGLKTILRAMEDCVYPPEPGLRSKFLGIEWDETLNRKRLNTISDKDIRGCVYHLNEYVEHTQRLRAMAVFATRVCPLNDDGLQLFGVWAKRSSFEILRDEEIIMGINSRIEIITAMIDAFEYIVDMLSGVDRHEYKNKLQDIEKTKEKTCCMEVG